MKLKNSFGTKFSGTIDKMTAVNRNGVNFLRTHVIPHNPKSPLQQRNRNHFAEGVETWRSLREVQRRFYNGIAKRTSGYNLFLSKWMESHSRGEDPTIPLVLAGTESQEAVWKRLLEIPYGETLSYEQMARDIGRPGAQRAVGRANGDNRLAIVVPCHRVIRSDGTLCGYGGGLWRKQHLLDLERGRIGSQLTLPIIHPR